MADDKAPNPNTSVDLEGKAINAQLPGIIKAFGSQILPWEQSKLAATQAVSPAYSQLMTDLYKQYAPQLANTGNQIDTENRNSNATTTANILADQGAKAAGTYTSIDQANNPEYYKTRQLESDKLAQLLNSVNLNNANPEAERYINQENQRSGNVANSNATKTLSNALSFGNQMSNRQATLSNAIGQATQFLTPSKNQAASVGASVAGAPSTAGGAANSLTQFAGVTPTGSDTLATGNNVLGAASGAQLAAMNVNANRRDTLDRVNQVADSVSSNVSSTMGSL